MLSICTVNVTSVSYPILISEIYEIGFLDLFFSGPLSRSVYHISHCLLKCRGGLWEKNQPPS